MKSAELKVRLDPAMVAWVKQQGNNQSQTIRDLVSAAMRMADPTADKMKGQRYVHRVRGSFVTVLGEFQMQAAYHVKEGDTCIAYIHDFNRTQWVRPKLEFNDGRFLKVE